MNHLPPNMTAIDLRTAALLLSGFAKTIPGFQRHRETLLKRAENADAAN
jgi:hypothetical protein